MIDLPIEKFTCPCCGYMTLSDEPGSFLICPVCFWEDDLFQFNNPTLGVGANRISLKQAQINYMEIGACSKDLKRYVRGPLSDEPKDPTWRPLP